MTADLAILANDPSALERAADPAEFVVLACERAKEWLRQAVEHDEVEQIVEMKSQAEAVRVYTAQKQLGKDAELSAAEIVRRAERGIGLAIRKGQESGEIATSQEAKQYAGRVRQQKDKNSLLARPKLPSDIVPQDDLTGNGSGIYQLTDDVGDEQFESAVDQAKAEQNLSRANVVRKIRNQKSAVPATARWQEIADLAALGYTSRQIGKRMGVGDEHIRDIAREHDIELAADKAVGKTRKHDSARIVRETVHALEGLAMGAQLVDVADLDVSEAAVWATSLNDSLRVLNRLNKQMKEIAQ